MLFLLICVVAFTLRESTHSDVVLIGLAALVTAGVLVAFSLDTVRSAPETFVAMLAIGALAEVLDALTRSSRARR